MGMGNEHFLITFIRYAVSQLGVAQRCGLAWRQGNGSEV